MDINIASVKRFLRELEKITSSGKRIDIIPRPETNETILELGLTKKLCEEIILGLSAENFSHGPLPDHTRSGLLWVFGINVNGTELYIKLKVYNVNDTKYAKCISFHESNHPLNYPFKK